MSLFRQLLIANTQKKKRPYYCEVEYLETTGTQYINSGVPFHFSEDTVKLVAELTQLNTYQTVYGINETIDGAIQFFGVRQLSTQERWQGLGVSISYPAFTLNKQFTLQISRIDKTFFQYKNEEVFTGVTGDLIDTTLNGFIFSTTNNGKPAFNCIGKIYSFQQKRAGILIRDLIPVLDLEMRPAMYDKVSGELLYNAGRGEFSYGREIHPVDYLESTGTQYIDTGVYFNDTTHTYEWDIDAQAINSGYTSGYNWFTGYNQNGVNSCGTYGDNSTYTFYPAGKYYQNGGPVSTPSGGDKYAPVKNTISLTNKICDYPLVLFARMVSSSETIDAGGSKRIFSAKYYDNGELVRDYIPAVDENGVGFMFDRVSHSIYDNAGEGAFKYPAVELEYLKTDSNTNWISTAIKPTTQTNFEVKARYEGTSTNTTWALGATTWIGVHKNGPEETIGITQGTLTEKQCYIPYENNTDFTLKLDGQNVYADGVLVGTVQKSNATSTLDVFRYYNASNLWWNGRIYYFKVNEAGVPTLDLIPAFKDGQIGMYDKVNDVLYPNAGTGTFLSGKIIESGEE